MLKFERERKKEEGGGKLYITLTFTIYKRGEKRINRQSYVEQLFMSNTTPVEATG